MDNLIEKFEKLYQEMTVLDTVIHGIYWYLDNNDVEQPGLALSHQYNRVEEIIKDIEQQVIKPTITAAA